MPAPGESPDHDPIPRLQLTDHRTGDMAQTAGDPVALHRGADRLGHHESDVWAVIGIAVDGTHSVHDEIGLHRTHPVTDGGTELR